MSCNEDIRARVFDYIDGTLDAQSTERVARHLENCPDCRKLEQDYCRMIGDLSAVFEGSTRQHVPNETLVEYVDGPENLAEDIRDDIELHLAVCPSCERKVNMLRQVGAEQASRRRTIIQRWLPDFGRGSRRALAGLSAAAVLILAFAAVYWAIIGTDRESDIRFVSTQDIDWLHESTRSDQTVPVIRAENDWIRVGLKFLAFFDEETYTVQLRTIEGQILREQSINDDNYDGTGIGLAIETSSLPPGTYRLILISRRFTDDDYSVQIAYPFNLSKN